MMTGKKIMIVEDEIIIAEDIKNRLTKLGYVVSSVVSSGEEAIQKTNENKPDLILMDIVFDSKMDGIEAAKNIRSFLDIPVVYLTAYGDEKTLERAKVTEPYGYIIKPFKERELHITIEIALYKHEIEKRLKESDRMLKKSTQWLIQTIEGIGDAIIVTDLEGSIKRMNPIAESMTGWKQEEVQKKPLTNIFNIKSEDIFKKIEDPVKNVIIEDIFYNIILTTKEDKHIPVDIISSSIKDDRENVLFMVLPSAKRYMMR